MDYKDILEVDVDSAKSRVRGWISTLKIAVTAWTEGGIGEAAVEIGANLWSTLSREIVVLKKFAVGELSTGTALEIFSYNVFNNTKDKGTAAIHRCILTCNASSGPYTLNKGSVVASDNTNLFELDSVINGTFPFLLASGASQAFAFKSLALGSQANSAIGTITRLVTTYVGVTCTNPENLAGSNTSLITAGAGPESDEQLHEKNRSKWATRNALELVNSAYEYYAKQASEGVVRVFVDDTNPRGANTVDLWLASSTGGVGSGDITAVVTDIRRRVLSTVSVEAYSCPTFTPTITGTIYYHSDFAPADVQTSVRDSLIAAYGEQDIGGTSLPGAGDHRLPDSVISDAISAAVIGERKSVISHSLTAPVGPTTLGAHDVCIPGTWPPAGLTWIAVTPP